MLYQLSYSRDEFVDFNMDWAEARYCGGNALLVERDLQVVLGLS